MADLIEPTRAAGFTDVDLVWLQAGHAIFTAKR
jgi:hypothetical protein